MRATSNTFFSIANTNSISCGRLYYCAPWMRGHPEPWIFLHLTIPISLHVFQAVRNERAPWLSCQMQFLTSSNDKVASSIPMSSTAKTNRKNSSAVPHKFLGVWSKNRPSGTTITPYRYSSAAERLQHRRLHL